MIPVVGDLIATALSLWLVREARALGAPWHITARMLGNVAIQGIVGTVPVAATRSTCCSAPISAMCGCCGAGWIGKPVRSSAPDQAASLSALSLAGSGSGFRGRRGSGKSWLSYSVRMPL